MLRLSSTVINNSLIVSMDFMRRILLYSCLSVSFACLFLIRFESTASPFISELLDAGHIGVFFIFGWLLLPKISGDLKRRISVLVLVTMIASFTIEITQELVGRAFEWLDIVRNYLGLGLGVALRSYFLTSVKSNRRRAILACLGLIVLIFLATNRLLQLAVGQVYFQINMPVLADFKHQFETANWQGRYAKIRYTDAGLLVEADSTKKFSGAFFHDFPSNWSDYQNLHINIHSRQPDVLSLTLKITDLEHERGSHHYDERYNGKLSLLPGNNQFAIPLSVIQSAPKHRNLDMQQIKRLELFLTDADDSDSFVIESLYLSRIPADDTSRRVTH